MTLTQEQIDERNAKARAKYQERRKDPAYAQYHRDRISRYNKSEAGKKIQAKAQRDYRAKINLDPEKREAWLERQRVSSRKSYEKTMLDPERSVSLRETRRVYKNEKMSTDDAFRLASNIRSRIAIAIRDASTIKLASMIELTGCSVQDLRKHLELQFKDGQSWDNYGRGTGFWNVDHVKPCASFDLSTEPGQRAAFHYTNLQPMWSIENSAKNSVVDGVKRYYTDHVPPEKIAP
jgi:hypothetical protein